MWRNRWQHNNDRRLHYPLNNGQIIQKISTEMLDLDYRWDQTNLTHTQNMPTNRSRMHILIHPQNTVQDTSQINS